MKINKSGTIVNAYTPEDLATFLHAIIEAKMMWVARCKEYVEKHGDKGSCVIGAGIKVYMKLPRKKYAIPEMLISPYEVTPFQGSCIWESSANEIVEFLQSKGLDCFFAMGTMD